MNREKFEGKEKFCDLEDEILEELVCLDLGKALDFGAYEKVLEMPSEAEKRRERRSARLEEIKDKLSRSDPSSESMEANIARRTLLYYVKLCLFCENGSGKERELLFLPGKIHDSLFALLHLGDFRDKERGNLLRGLVEKVPRLLDVDRAFFELKSEKLAARAVESSRRLEELLASLSDLLEKIDKAPKLSGDFSEKRKDALRAVEDYREGLENASPEVDLDPFGKEKLERLFELDGACCGAEELESLGKGLLRESRNRMRELAEEMGGGGGISGSFGHISRQPPNDRTGVVDWYRKAAYKGKEYMRERILLDPPPGEGLKIVGNLRSNWQGSPRLKYYPPPSRGDSRDALLSVKVGKSPGDEVTWPSHWQIQLGTLQELYPGAHMMHCRQSVGGHPSLALFKSSSTLGGWSLYSSGFMDHYGFRESPEMSFIRVKSLFEEAALAIAGTRLLCGRIDFQDAVRYLADSTGKPIREAERELLDLAVEPARLTRLWGRKLIKELKSKVEWELGGAYSDRFFHNSVTDKGPLRFEELKKLVLAETKEIGKRYREEAGE